MAKLDEGGTVGAKTANTHTTWAAVHISLGYTHLIGSRLTTLAQYREGLKATRKAAKPSPAQIRAKRRSVQYLSN